MLSFWASFFFSLFHQICLKSQYILTIDILGKIYQPWPPKGPYLILNGPPGKVLESLDNEHNILCLHVLFLGKRSIAFRSIYKPYVLLAEKHRYECADDNSQMRCECLRCSPETSPRTDTPIQSLRAVGSKQDKTLGPHCLEDFRSRMAPDFTWNQGRENAKEESLEAPSKSILLGKMRYVLK